MDKILDDVRRDACKKLTECETEDLKILVDTADILMQFRYMVRREGLLALDGAEPDDAKGVLPEYGKMLQQLVGDGTEPDTVVEIGTNEYWKEDPQGVESMVWYMYLRGICGIQAGENPSILQTVFQTLMPLRCRSLWQERIRAEKEREEADLISRFATLSPVFENRELIEKLHELEQEMEVLDDRAVQRILREASAYKLTLCLYGLNEGAREKILGNVSRCLVGMLREDAIYLDELGDVKESDVLKSVASILGIIKTLRDGAEIV